MTDNEGFLVFLIVAAVGPLFACGFVWRLIFGRAPRNGQRIEQ